MLRATMNIMALGVLVSGLAAPRASAAPCLGGVLTIPDAVSSRVWTFDINDGSILDQNFLPSDGRMITPLDAVCSQQQSVFVSDPGADAIYQYDFFGNYLRTVATAADGIVDPRGMAVSEGRLYVAVTGGTLANTIQRFDVAGGGQVTWASTNLSEPSGLVIRDGDVLVTNAGSSRIERFDRDGVHLGLWHAGNIRRPLQIGTDLEPDRYLVGGNATPSGIFQYEGNGTQTNLWALGRDVRGAFRLGNGNILFTDGLGVHLYEFASAGDPVTTIASGGGFGFVEAVLVIPAPSVGAPLVIWVIFQSTAARRRQRRSDDRG